MVIILLFSEEVFGKALLIIDSLGQNISCRGIAYGLFLWLLNDNISFLFVEFVLNLIRVVPDFHFCLIDPDIFGKMLINKLFLLPELN